MMKISKTVETTQRHPQLSSMKIVKRDGRLVDFDDQKIYDALVKAKTQVSGELSPLDHERILEIVERVPRNCRTFHKQC